MLSAKINVKLGLGLLKKHYVMKMYAEQRNNTNDIFSALGGGDWSSSGSSRFNPGEAALDPIVQEAGWTIDPVWTL